MKRNSVMSADQLYHLLVMISEEGTITLGPKGFSYSGKWPKLPRRYYTPLVKLVEEWWDEYELEGLEDK